jgi:hypothetical protein
LGENPLDSLAVQPTKDQGALNRQSPRHLFPLTLLCAHRASIHDESRVTHNLSIVAGDIS